MRTETNEKYSRIKVMKVLLTVLSAACFAYGLVVLSILGPWGFFNYAFAAIGSVLALCRVFWDRLAGLKTGVRRTLSAVVIAFLAVFIACVCIIVSCAAGSPAENADYVIILGAKVNGETPSVEFSQRIRMAAAYLKDNPSSRAVATGGKGGDEGIAESAAAEKTLVSLGVSAGRILKEEKSTSTEENFRFAAEAIKKQGDDPADVSVVIVSSSFHLFRAGLHARSEGFENISYLGSTGLKILLPQYYLREFAALAYEAVFWFFVLK